VLVLDDALSAVDTRTEARIRQALQQRHGRRTTIVIAHRLSTIASADRIVVLQAGRVVQNGSHRELLGADGPYRRFHQLQAALEDQMDQDLSGAASPPLASGE
jgi:ATP-binding cassette subfamily B protein